VYIYINTHAHESTPTRTYMRIYANRHTLMDTDTNTYTDTLKHNTHTHTHTGIQTHTRATHTLIYLNNTQITLNKEFYGLIREEDSFGC